jgi:hypothetical protein
VKDRVEVWNDKVWSQNQRSRRKASRNNWQKSLARNNESIHKTVLLNETIEGLNLKNGAVVFDALLEEEDIALGDL